MFRKSEILLLLVVAAAIFSLVAGKRGPHHPRSEPLGKVNEHIVHNDEHLKEDLRASHVRPEKPVEEMTEEEKHFYHFKMYDYDNNNLLDGLEILQHEFHEDSHKKATKLNRGGSEGAAAVDSPVEDELYHNSIEHLVDIIDEFLLIADKNNDGFLNFNEYKDSLRESGASSHDEQGAGEYNPTKNDNDEVVVGVGANKL